jgi:UDP-2-acetamido-2,6-beta-L-arabino-hexul-4-ose reductase
MSRILKYQLNEFADERGAFAELFRINDKGQVSVNIIKPGKTKGNHWHHTKVEKFLVVAGKGVIRFREVNNNEIIEYNVSGEKLEVVEIPVGYSHNIENLGDVDLVFLIWANEVYDKTNPDTFHEKV